jgi:Gluconate 2-dehydrogenase subunit 3
MVSMDRREALRLLATGTALQLAPRNLLAVLREARKLIETPVAPRTLSVHQEATVKAMADLILPKTDTPGAADVGASEFIDLMLTEWYDEPDRTLFLNGLAEADLQTQSLFGRNFVDGSPDQRSEILTWLGQKMTAEAGALETGPRRRRVLSRNFYSMFRRLTLTAYYTSEAGATDELHFQVIPDSHDGCAKLPSGKGGAENQ